MLEAALEVLATAAENLAALKQDQNGMTREHSAKLARLVSAQLNAAVALLEAFVVAQK